MKKLLILSGKGGTGKTTTAAAFIRFSEARAFADCDVDAPNLHMVANMQQKPKQSDHYGSEKAVIQQDTCIGCGQCKALCRYGAVEEKSGKYTISAYGCEGCGVCAYACPTKSIEMVQDVAGEMELYEGDTVFSTARLKTGRGNSGKLVTAVKNALFDAAPETELAVIDGSPGIGCPVIASMSGVDFVLIVTEPSVSGISDMERILKTAGIFQTKAAVCVNKYTISMEKTKVIEEFCREHEIPFVGKIPYDKQASLAINAGKSIADADCPARTALHEVYEKVMVLMGMQKA